LKKSKVDKPSLDGSETEDEEEYAAAVNDDLDDEHIVARTDEVGSPATGTRPNHQRTSSVAEDVITRKGGYGRFAQKWFSRRGWTVDQRRSLGMSVSDSPVQPEQKAQSSGTSTLNQVVDSNAKVLDGEGTSSGNSKSGGTGRLEANEITENLLPKLLRTTQILFGSSRSFFFSYDYDITRSFANQKASNSNLPQYKEADPLFFWNRNIIQPFIDAGQPSLALPLLQGFVGQRSFEMDMNPPKPVFGLDGVARSSVVELADLSKTIQSNEDSHAGDSSLAGEHRSSEDRDTKKSFLLTLISRRSVKRAGLRYLRRGIDEEGNTANGVETEQILSDADWDPTKKIHSFVQIRGSIPIFFSQTPYAFKPVPQIQHSPETNYVAFSKHFEQLSQRYGSVQVANLVEKHGNEAIVGNQYQKYMEQLNESGGVNGQQVGFEWFDFHAKCRGMKFENVSLLTDALGEKLDSFGYTVVDGQQCSKQSGVLRTNCMDCLDRTNIVQSASGRRALELQLKDEGIDMSLQLDQATSWFNTLWADNGDAVSKQYASTSAMKGDFTRTRKRDYKGALTDMGLSISRFYSGYVLALKTEFL
jgi:hypothetical protein